MIAALTKNVRFIPNIILAALRQPIVLAKMTATLDASVRVGGEILGLAGHGASWGRLDLSRR